MRTSKFTKEAKTKILIEKEQSNMTVEEICSKYGISTPTFYSWKREMSNIFEHEVVQHNMGELQKENHTLRRLYIDLSEHNYQLAQFLEK